ncbi:hypothetical protein GO730_39070 [Spirosoma sp. HMF3257]|uniref:Trypsin-like peptidase domain-containing protein n=1 Tax=Spirosoma telluris TaxID=2183553 RepID=A0A327NCU6_9BACT|nr:hypothetical protein [Spirosoma telluris]RAI72892.1 hypothetical protein HMF3257_38985 [Spirosoma telluris]
MILSDKLHELSVRLSIDGELIGSGFLLNIKEQGIVYLLTARHVLDEVSEDEIIDVASFNYHDQKFIDKIQVNISNVIKFPETDETDIALWILSNQVLPDLATVSVNETVPGKIDIHFDGFPAAYKGEEPLPVMAKLSRSFNNKSKIRTDQSFEDNSSTALANVKGTSGSGLYWEREGEMILVGIITNYEARFKLFTAYHLSEV